MKKAGSGFLILVLASACQTGKTSTGDLYPSEGSLPPVVIDLSPKTPTPAATPVAVARAATAVPATPTAIDIPATSAEAQVVAAQIDAFNRHDLEAFVATYAADATLYDQPDRVRQSGMAEIRQSYASAFAGNPALHVSVSSRIVQGRFVIQQETLTGAADGQTRTSVATYEVVGGKIARVWFAK